MLISKEVEVELNSYNKRYEKLGYEIPTVTKQLWFQGKKNGKKKTVKKGTKITVKVDDLAKGNYTKVQVQCDNCKKIYNLAYSNYITQTNKHNGVLYCSDCANTVLFSGELNHSYNPNKTDEERALNRNIDGYDDFIKSVMKLSSYKCSICNSNENLEVHHLNGYEWCKEERTKISNGICLCHKCHRSFHSLYGYKKNTKEQFVDWCNNSINLLEDKKVELKTYKKVICLETKKIYDSAYKCEKELLHNKMKKGLGTTIRRCCDSHGSSYGMHFVWLEDYENMSNEDILNILKPKNLGENFKKQVVCLELMLLFDSVTDACSYFCKKSTSNLSGHLLGRRPKYVGYHWCYLSNYKGDIQLLKKVGGCDEKYIT